MAGNLDEKSETSYQRTVRVVQEEFSRQYIHERLEIKHVVRETGLGYGTVKNFFGWTKDGFKTRSPRMTTVLAIADALGIEVEFRVRATGKLIKTRRRR